MDNYNKMFVDLYLFLHTFILILLHCYIIIHLNVFRGQISIFTIKINIIPTVITSIIYYRGVSMYSIL